MKEYFIITDKNDHVVDLFHHEWLDFVIVDKWYELRKHEGRNFRCTVYQRTP